jgi:NADPH-dependent curcumin reductase CurA
MSKKNGQWILVERPTKMIEQEHFEWHETEVESPDSGEVLVRAIYLSLDPTNRGWMSHDTYLPKVPLGEVMRGIGIGVVEESRHPEFQEGDLVQGLTGWQEYLITDGSGFQKVETHPGVPLSAQLALLGHIGLTAYVGLLHIGEAKEGETVVVSAASGAVGSIAGQIARIQGCRVVGITGGKEKCRHVVTSLGFDKAVDYKTDDFEDKLTEACPEGIDVDFENVGGRVMDSVLALMNQGGRVVLCGLISQYNTEGPVPGPYHFAHILIKRLKVQGFIVLDHIDLALEANQKLVKWYREGKIHTEIEMVDGLENAVTAINRLFEGSKFGKLLVKVSDEPV